MAGDDVLRAGGQPAQRLEAFQHLADMEGGGEGPAALHVLVEMRHVRGQHHGAAFGRHRHALQPGGMAAHQMGADARRDIRIAVQHPHPPAEIQLHHAGDVIRLEAVGQLREAHEAAAGIVHLRFLQVEIALGNLSKLPTWS